MRGGPLCSACSAATVEFTGVSSLVLFTQSQRCQPSSAPVLAAIAVS
ncbi:hypothetical protein [Actinokineospora sp. NPDC004072]